MEVEAPLLDDERFAQAAIAAAKKVRDENADHERERQTEIDEAKSKLARARKLLQQSGLWAAAPQTFERIRHWPSWLKNGTWQLPFSVSGVAGEFSIAQDQGGTRASWVAWEWEGTTFRYELEEHSSHSYDGLSLFGTLDLSADGSTVMILEVSKNLEKEFSNWCAFEVSALVPGPWMARLADFAERLALAERDRYANRELDRLQAKAKQIELDD